MDRSAGDPPYAHKDLDGLSSGTTHGLRHEVTCSRAGKTYASLRRSEYGVGGFRRKPPTTLQIKGNLLINKTGLSCHTTLYRPEKPLLIGSGGNVGKGGSVGNGGNVGKGGSGSVGSDVDPGGSCPGSGVSDTGGASTVGTGSGDVVSGGVGVGDVVSDGSGVGDAINGGSGVGDTVRGGSGVGDVANGGVGVGDVVSDGSGVGDVANGGSGVGDVANSGSGVAVDAGEIKLVREPASTVPGRKVSTKSAQAATSHIFRTTDFIAIVPFISYVKLIRKPSGVLCLRDSRTGNSFYQ